MFLSRSRLQRLVADRVDRAIAGSFIPEQYYNSVTDCRDISAQTLLQQQVTNPFHIENFASIRTSNPALYERMANAPFFQARTTQHANHSRVSAPQRKPLLYANQRGANVNPLLMTSRLASSRLIRWKLPETQNVFGVFP